MLTKDHHCLESILEATDRIIEYTSGYNSADDFNNDYRNFDATMIIDFHGKQTGVFQEYEAPSKIMFLSPSQG